MRKCDCGEDSMLSSYEAFQDSGASSPADRALIARPTLLVTAIDDPLHNPDMLGFGTDHKSMIINVWFTVMVSLRILTG